LIIHQIDLKNNLKFFDVNVTLINDGVRNTLISGTGEFYFDLLKMTVKLLVRLPENDRDENYQRVFFRTSIDLTKFFNGIGGTNPVTKALMESFTKSIDFDPKLPLKKVVIESCLEHVAVLFHLPGYLQDSQHDYFRQFPSSSLEYEVFH
jgi:hypothetical protein